MLLISLYDRDQDAHSNPTVYVNEAMAIRALKDALADPNRDVTRHANSYELRLMATFDPISGAIVPPQNGPQRIIQAHQLLETK